MVSLHVLRTQSRNACTCTFTHMCSDLDENAGLPCGLKCTRNAISDTPPDCAKSGATDTAATAPAQSLGCVYIQEYIHVYTMLLPSQMRQTNSRAPRRAGASAALAQLNAPPIRQYATLRPSTAEEPSKVLARLPFTSFFRLRRCPLCSLP